MTQDGSEYFGKPSQDYREWLRLNGHSEAYGRLLKHRLKQRGIWNDEKVKGDNRRRWWLQATWLIMHYDSATKNLNICDKAVVWYFLNPFPGQPNMLERELVKRESYLELIYDPKNTWHGGILRVSFPVIKEPTIADRLKKRLSTFLRFLRLFYP